jgi:hypothetical protein
MTKFVRVLGLSLLLSGCGLGGLLSGSDTPDGASAKTSVKQFCEEDKAVNVVVNATNNCDKSHRTAEPFIVQVPAEEQQ